MGKQDCAFLIAAVKVVKLIQSFTEAEVENYALYGEKNTTRSKSFRSIDAAALADDHQVLGEQIRSPFEVLKK
jgi:hypothetical protein